MADQLGSCFVPEERDDGGLSEPAISTAVTPKYQMGKKAAEFLYERMNGYDGPSRHEVLRAQLAIRNSTLKTAAKTLDAIVLDDRNTIYK